MIRLQAITNHEGCVYLGTAALDWGLPFETVAAIVEPGMYWVVELCGVLENALVRL